MANDESIGLKVGAGIVIGALVGGFSGALIADDQSQVDKLTADIEAMGEPITVTEIVEVPVNSDNLDLVLKHLYDNDGTVEYLLDDLDDDELDQIVDRIVFVNEASDKAVAYVKGLDFADELEDSDLVYDVLDDEDNVIETVGYDEDEVKRVRVQDDHDDIVYFDEQDFEDSDINMGITVNFEHDGVKLKALVLVEVEDNKVNDFEILKVIPRSDEFYPVI